MSDTQSKYMCTCWMAGGLLRCWKHNPTIGSVPPHAAGEEIPTDTIGAVGLEFCGSWIDLTRHEWALCAEVARLRALVSPAASQAAPEMPEWMVDWIAETRGLQKAGKLQDPGPGIVLLWLADRVAELERELVTSKAAHQDTLDMFRRAQRGYEDRLAALQAFAALTQTDQGGV